MSIISLQPCEFSYSSRVILNNISFTCEDRDRLCIVEPNGAGKTTLLRIIRHELEARCRHRIEVRVAQCRRFSSND